jgi:tight adherence protein C
LALGFLMIVLTSVTGIIKVSDDLVLPVCVGAVLAGCVLPEAYVKNVAQKRRETLNYLLPEGLDLLTICVEAGLSIDAAFRRVSREMQNSMPELATEFEITAIELTYLPDRQQALENMTDRSDSPAVAALVNALRQTEKYGTPLAASLRILSQEFRQTRQSKAEEKGARMPALMTVPLMVFILPTLITVLIAPAIMSAFALG